MLALNRHCNLSVAESFSYQTANCEDGVCLDVVTWNNRQPAFFDIRVFNPNTPSYSSKTITACYTRNKNRIRNEIMMNGEIEHGNGCFTPLVFSTDGGMGTCCPHAVAKI